MMQNCHKDAHVVDEPKEVDESLLGIMNRDLITTSSREGISSPFEWGGQPSTQTPTIRHSTTLDVLNDIDDDLFSFEKTNQPMDDLSIVSCLSSALEPTPIKPGLLLVRPEEHQSQDHVVNYIGPDVVRSTDAAYIDFQHQDDPHAGEKRRNISTTDSRPNKRSRTNKTETKRNKNSKKHQPNFRPYQHHQFQEKYQALLRFKERHGHCLVPHTYEEDRALARWVKRQRYQYKLKVTGKGDSTMTQERIDMLEAIGFVWDSHKLAWEDHLKELKVYKDAHGDCNVPSTYLQNPSLGAWVKCQRRQYRRLFNGESFNITFERISALDALGFDWKQRSESLA